MSIVQEKDVAQLKARLDSWKPNHRLMSTLAETALNDIKLNFRKGVDPDGIAWPKLKPATIRRRRKGKNKGRPDQPLVDSGLLRNSITSQVTRDEATIGTNKLQARAMHFGVTKQNIPARPFLGIGDRMVTKLERNVARFIEEQLNANA